MTSNQTKNADLAALYARYSSDLQSEASIADQLRICAEWAAKQRVTGHRELHGSGYLRRSLTRPGIQKLLQDAAAGKFDVVLSESLDRLSRDQEDIAHVYKRISDPVRRRGNKLHIGLKGTMGRSTSRNVPSCRSLPDLGGPGRRTGS